MTSPVLGIDHIRVSCRDLNSSEAEVTELLGFEPIWRGSIAGDSNSEASAPRNRAALYETSNLYFLLQESDGAPGLNQLCLQVDSIDRMARRLKQLGMAFFDRDADPLQEALKLDDSRSLETAIESTRGISLRFVARNSRPARPCDDAAHVSGLDHILINSASAEGTAYLFGAQLGLDMRMDISRPEWGARLMFFRCGDLIVEVFQHLGDKSSATSDSFYGLSWRVPDAEKAKARLELAGRDVSDVRKGRKPGTRVFTSRERNVDVPTLMIEPPAD